jgi:hypothetical protein
VQGRCGCYGLWKGRNDLVFIKVLIDPKRMMHKLTALLKCSEVLVLDKKKAKMEAQM